MYITRYNIYQQQGENIASNCFIENNVSPVKFGAQKKEKLHKFTRCDLRRNLRIWWCVLTTSNNVIFTSKIPSCLVAIYWILKIWFFSFRYTFTKKHFLCLRRTLYMVQKLLYCTINLVGWNKVKNGQKRSITDENDLSLVAAP